MRDTSPDQGRLEGGPLHQESRLDAGTGTSSEPLLRVEDLHVEFATDDGIVHAVDGITYQVQRGRTLGIVGESGSGKTVSSLTTLGLTRSQGAHISGRILFEGRDLVALSEDELRTIRGNEIAMIFQDPLSSLHPFYRVGTQLVEAVLAHQDVSKAKARERAVELLGLVGIPDPSRRVEDYPHEFSGGMRQRAMIAMALANDPQLLIADEPTTALDVTVQAQILALMERLQRELGMAIVIITHDLGVVAEMADDIAVMYAGRIVETASAKLVFSGPEHPYTWGLLKSIPTLAGGREEDLVPIPGTPPSLINRPSGCHFHPRCPYAQPDHSRIDPQLAPVAEMPSHHVACLLESELRRRLWAELRRGCTPEQARDAVGLPAPQSATTEAGAAATQTGATAPGTSA
jgi:peptide/nickel transport system ATP-binding protein